MADIYKRLAKKLDRLPNGFPSTQSGVELKILRKIFAPEDARLALKLKPIPDTAENIARKLGKPLDITRKTLDRMAELGQIGSFKLDGVQKYAFMPFVIGIYEFQLKRMDKELADFFEDYIPHLLPAVGRIKPALARVVPVNASIDVKAEILTYEDMRSFIRESRSFMLNECICRKERALQGHPCKHTLETCMVFSPEEAAYNYSSMKGRVISKEEAFQVLDTAEKEGLIHATYNVRERPMFVCNCCSCCCGLMRGLKEFRVPHLIARSNFVAAIDAGSCNQCGLCATERCPVQAISSENERFSVSNDRCIGCGTCAVTCPTGSIKLIRRAQPEQTVPSKDTTHWYVERASNRGGLLTRMALRLWLARFERQNR